MPGSESTEVKQLTISLKKNYFKKDRLAHPDFCLYQARDKKAEIRPF
jgi:hypothetical protein